MSNYASYKDALIVDGATSYYPLSETSGIIATDLIGNTTASINGGVTLNQKPILGNSTPSMLFDGSTGYVALPSSIKPDGLSSWSAEFWFEYPSSHHGGRALDNAHTDQSNTGFQFNLDSTNGGLASLATSAGTINMYWSYTYAIETPYHHVMTYNGTTAYLYLNGAQVGTSPQTGTILSAAYPINAGRGAYNNDYYQGRLGHIAFYPLALTQAQIASHYSTGLEVFTSPGTLVVSDKVLTSCTLTDIGVM